ncbi:uncharacterized protein LOC127260988 [Andrographis paniculata]|uniref:uncharacterized protein LOC127260988 n=1 Tax=Andrographis paniculata TaxID=175694 RepID=UPI0021E9567B|nr:uncharacterized protein LOC127260988 [Andrographis paniculata]
MVSPSSLSPSKKLLFTDPNPKSKPNSAALPPTRVQGQPNLSDCHGCGYQINHANPKDRLQLLDSIWRIVLLCRECRKAIRFGHKCPYCFRETVNSGNLFHCDNCARKIHDDCVRDCGNCTPWRGMGAQLEEPRVCVDCWVPELLKKSFRVFASDDKMKGKLKAKKLLGKIKKPKVQKVWNRRPRNVVPLGNVVLALPAKNYQDRAASYGGSRARNLNCAAVDVNARKSNNVVKTGKLESCAEGLRAESLHDAKDGVRAENTENSAKGVRVENIETSAKGVRVEHTETSAKGVRVENIETSSGGVRAENFKISAEDAGAETIDNAKNDVRTKNVESSREGLTADTGNKVEGDAELEILLQRAMNITKSVVDVSNYGGWNGLTYKRHGLGRVHVGGQRVEAGGNFANSKRMAQPRESGPIRDANGLNSVLFLYNRDEKRKLWQKFDEDTVVKNSESSKSPEMKLSSHSDDSKSLKSTADVSESLLDSIADQNNTCRNSNRSDQEFEGYKSTRFKKKAFQVDGLANVTGECISCDNIMVILKCDNSQPGDEQLDTGLLAQSDARELLQSKSCDEKVDHCRAEIDTHTNTENQASRLAEGSSEAGRSGECGEESNLQASNRDTEPYFFKYTKRMKRTTDSYSFKYSKRSKGSTPEANLQPTTSVNGNEDSAPGLTTNSKAESWNESDVSLDSSMNNVPE